MCTKRMMEEEKKELIEEVTAGMGMGCNTIGKGLST